MVILLIPQIMGTMPDFGASGIRAVVEWTLHGISQMTQGAPPLRHNETHDQLDLLIIHQKRRYHYRKSFAKQEEEKLRTAMYHLISQHV
jgi:hypothetical protein